MITLNQHKSNVYSRIMRTFSDDSAPVSAFSSWFPSFTTLDRLVSIQVRRNRQLIAVDVRKNTGGNINKFSNYTEKMYEPPAYIEKFDFSTVQYHDVTFGNNNNPNVSQAHRMIAEATDNLLTLKHKVQRAIEKQRSQVLQTGVVTLKNGDNIDFKRKAASLVAKTGTEVWSNAAGKPLDDIATGIKFIRQEGKSASRSYDLIMGEAAFASFMANVQVKEAAEFRRINILEIGTTKFDNTTGLNYHGRISTKNGNVDLWTYDDFYEDPADTYNEYVDPKNVILLPRDFVGNTSYAGMPQIMRDKSNAEFPQYIQQQEAEFFMNNWIDANVKAHWFEIASSPLAVPTSIDRVWTAQVEE
ncbi:major capsid protein [Flagellimonas nanhaiensis]|uniref:Major capsid protein n=1 Tax=Flagellimonas nanhaiensis TaxID=2292706 RepID=A0A371JL77_9FLAO|nr:major capsid protein [Allomuricauda nanhaiensis]RDY57707.1 hypothetical protein DX873_17555 [Allomuricauda nanhaiensis]